jgi:hypothetical protein
MKKLITLIGVAALLATVSYAQSTTDNSQLKKAVIAFAQNVSTNREITATVYPSYAPSIVVNGKKDNFGFGAAVLTPVSLVPALADNTIAQHSFVGLRFDYLAHQAFASTVGVGMKGDWQLWKLNNTAFGETGANIPFSGFGIHNGEIGAMVGSGNYTMIHSWGKSKLGFQVSIEKWTQFPGVVWHFGPVFTLDF